MTEFSVNDFITYRIVHDSQLDDERSFLEYVFRLDPPLKTGTFRGSRAFLFKGVLYIADPKIPTGPKVTLPVSLDPKP